MRVESVGYQGGESFVAHEGVVVRLIGPGFFSSCVISSIPQAAGASAELTMLAVSLTYWWSSAFLLGCFSFNISPPGFFFDVFERKKPLKVGMPLKRGGTDGERRDGCRRLPAPEATRSVHH